MGAEWDLKVLTEKNGILRQIFIYCPGETGCIPEKAGRKNA
jgi:hypothetical protein